MKSQTFKIKIEGDRKVTTAEILDLLEKHLKLSGKSLAVINWDTKEAEGLYGIE